VQHYPFKASAGSSHQRLIRLIPRWAKRGGRFVDLGAFGGEIGGAVRPHFAHTAAVERDPDQIPHLAARYDSVIIADLEQVTRVPGEMDAVLLADVLEHLRAPDAILRLASIHLAPGGKVFISIPNVANLAVRLHLLLGRFEYADRGILDRTHLRFFTRRTARALVESSGLRIVHEETTPVPIREAFPHWPSLLLRPLETLILLLTPLWPTLMGYQFIFVAEKK
jgi:predicted TPR repeat methyltransferase